MPARILSRQNSGVHTEREIQNIQNQIKEKQNILRKQEVEMKSLSGMEESWVFKILKLIN